MNKRTGVIQRWIEDRKEHDETTKCVFYITTPRLVYDNKNETIEKIKGILDNNNVAYRCVDTVSGAWNLNRSWIETDKMDCIVEFCGVYPTSWGLEDIVELEQMETNGDIVIHVEWVVDEKYIPNH